MVRGVVTLVQAQGDNESKGNTTTVNENTTDADEYFRKHKNFGKATAEYNDKNIAQLIENYNGDELAQMDVPYEQALAAGVLAWKMRRHAKECNGC